MQKVITLPFLVLIRFYRSVISPWLPFACRFQPTCSEYAKEAFTKYGLLKGSYLSLQRILRCHPLGGSGYNPVPTEKEAAKSNAKAASSEKIQIKNCCGSSAQHH